MALLMSIEKMFGYQLMTILTFLSPHLLYFVLPTLKFGMHRNNDCRSSSTFFLELGLSVEGRSRNVHGLETVVFGRRLVQARLS